MFQTPTSPKRPERWNIGTSPALPPSPPRGQQFPMFNQSTAPADWDGASAVESAVSDIALVLEELRQGRERQAQKNLAQATADRAERAERDKAREAQERERAREREAEREERERDRDL